jgi:hypothetical protein
MIKKKEINRLKHFKPNTEENVALEMCSIKELVVMMMVMIYSIKEEVKKKMLEVETCICIEVEVGKEMFGVVRTCKHTELVVKVVTCKHKGKVGK